MKRVSAYAHWIVASALPFAIYTTPSAVAQTANGTAQASAPQPEYHPSLGDLMTMAVQPRHIKLGIAGERRNWSYARYELSELRNAFGRIARTIPVYRNTELAGLFAALTDGPLQEVGLAIDAGDAAKFKTAYARLTSACNACHLTQEHPWVVIRVPDAKMFPDQDFRAH